ncbi:short-chain dehydrogenase [Desulfosarcina widdelii]|uniref:Short-chain dehydrogenase n=1 Tax=Desulfosarcina widdelii TaxID=947919 RepID=A0A5K7YZU9_9BACT|nr:SDR family oxidoreductase [Desulfosarcina widdelii]BBO75242.1 short-chain dehydrogenase [Desulfosarcina widdelii]
MKTLSYGLDDKVAVVTGGSRGIGLDMAKTLLAQGAKVAICGRKQEGLDAAVAEMDGGDRVLAVAAHVAKAEDVDRLFAQTVERFGRIDVLLNNVGMNLITSVVDAEPALFSKIVESNLTGTWLCSRKAARLMREQKAGKIVSITSIAARRAAPFMGVYGIAKAAIEMMTKTLAQELAPFNIQVNAVAPCMVRTGFSKPFWSNEEMLKEIVKAIPMGRIAETADVVHPALFLSSDGAGFITGQTLMVDGGASAV